MAEVADKIKEMDALAKKAHKGDAESMFQLAVRRYWEYDTFPGIETRDCAFKMLHAAGQHGDSRMNRKVGDFFRNEFQETRAQTHYEMALMKAMEEAQAGNYGVTSSIAEQYALGIGVPQNDEKAAFWTQWGAHHGNDEDRAMVKNLWQDGSVLPVSEEMASAITERGTTASDPKCADFEEIYDAASQVGILSDYLDILKRLDGKNCSKVKVTDKSQSLVAKMRNAIVVGSNTVASFLYSLLKKVSYLSLFVTVMFGYQETGLISIINRIFYFCLAVPFKIFVALLAKIPFSELDLKAVCMMIDTKASGIGLIDALFCFVIMAIWTAIWLKIIKSVFGKIGRKVLSLLTIRQIFLSNNSIITYRSQIENQGKKLIQAQNKLDTLIRKNNIPEHMSKPVILLALYDIAANCGYKNISETVNAYQNMVDRKEKATISVNMGEKKSLMPLYFTMNRLMPGCAQYAGICSKPKYNFSEYGNFMDGYIAYRQGKHFDKVEKCMREVLASPQVTGEKGYAAWYLSLMYEEEHISANRNQEIRDSHNKMCKEESASMLRKAKQYGCPLANIDGVGGCRQLWQARYNSMKSLAQYFYEEDNQYQYFTWLANADRDRLRECGNPLDAADWNGYETGCVWPIYKSVLKKYSEKKCGEAELNKLLVELSEVKDSGVKRITELYEQIHRELKAIRDDREMNRMLAQDRMEKQQRDEFLRNQEWERQQDARERDRNMFLHHDYDTDFGRSLRGEISQEEFLVRDMLRDEARRKFQEEMDDD